MRGDLNYSPIWSSLRRREKTVVYRQVDISRITLKKEKEGTPSKEIEKKNGVRKINYPKENKEKEKRWDTWSNPNPNISLITINVLDHFLKKQNSLMPLKKQNKPKLSLSNSKIEGEGIHKALSSSESTEGNWGSWGDARQGALSDRTVTSYTAVLWSSGLPTCWMARPLWKVEFMHRVWPAAPLLLSSSSFA